MGTKSIVVVTRTMPGRFEISGAEVRWGGDECPTRQQLLELVRGKDGATVVVTMFTDRVDDELLDAAGPGLKGVCNMAVGYDNVDLAACRARGVLVTNTPHVVTEGTADLAWMLVLAACRRLVEADRFARSPAYHEGLPLGMAEFLGMDLTGRTLLVIGAGRIGRATALRSIGWGMRVLYVDPKRCWPMELAPIAATRVDLDEGLQEADVVSVHTPLTPQTHHLIDARALSLMKPTAVLVNTARGPVVDETALYEALRDRRIYGAGLDVFEHEPRVHAGLVGLENVVLTPHIGSAEKRYREQMTEMVRDNVMAILGGRTPPNLVTVLQ